MSDYKIKIMHLYPNLLNLYGDKGNIATLLRRLEWRGIDAEVEEVFEADVLDFSFADIVFLGGGTEREVRLVLEQLIKKKDELKAFVDSEKTILAVCEGFEMLGEYFYMNDERLSGLGILDIRSEKATDQKRILGDTVIECDGIGYVVGFENHGGRTDIGSNNALGKIVRGGGNNGESGCEGLRYKNLFATHLHGPILPKNPKLCDAILEVTLKKKYADFAGLKPLDDEVENMANAYIVTRTEN